MNQYTIQQAMDTLDAQTITHTESGQRAVRQWARAWLQEFLDGKQGPVRGSMEGQ